MNYGLYHQKRSRVSVLNSLQYFARWRRLFVSDLVTRDISAPNPPLLTFHRWGLRVFDLHPMRWAA